MKKNIFIKALSILVIGYGMTSCLDGDLMNTPPGGSPPIVEMSYLVTNGTNINSGLQFFSGQTLLLNPTHTSDTITFSVTVQGDYSDEVNVTVNVDPAAAADNFTNDHLEYGLMPGNQWKLLSTTGTIEAGKDFVEFKLVVYPPNIDFTKNVILPIAVTNDKDLTVSSNFGKVYFHIIGNPIAGSYTWEYTRYPSYDESVGSDTHTIKPAVFAPVDATTIRVPTGYYSAPDYIITFDDDGAGHLTNFKAVIDPAKVTADFDPASIVITSAPTIDVSPDYKVFKIHYTVVSPSGQRSVHDDFTRN